MATVTAIARSQRMYEHLLVLVIIIKVARVHVYNWTEDNPPTGMNRIHGRIYSNENLPTMNIEKEMHNYLKDITS